MPLPNEENVRDHISKRFRAEFDLANEVLDFAISMPIHQEIHAKPDVTPRVEVVTLGLATKIFKQYRAIIPLLELGLAENAERTDHREVVA